LSRSATIILLVLALLLASQPTHAALTTGGCLALKRQTWGNLRKCEALEQAKALRGKPSDPAKCQTKFQKNLAKITDKAADAAIRCRYGDNGDQTVTDYDTGLQWEKEGGRFVINLGFVCLPGTVHCVNDTYKWNAANQLVDASADGTTRPTCFFGHCDWRLPTILELQSILLAPHPCGTNPCIDPIFGPTASGLYASSTTLLVSDPTSVWLVSFNSSGQVIANFKEAQGYYIRAVRTAL